MTCTYVASLCFPQNGFPDTNASANMVLLIGQVLQMPRLMRLPLYETSSIP